jgi:hypothetical protein
LPLHKTLARLKNQTALWNSNIVAMGVAKTHSWLLRL